ncbi:hypothetical protein OHB54_45205 [Streptomyces sp. NBC_01007]|nr:hypothetical protein OHB54_45205 [Streptomyces sp. NBC_01007]
MRGGGCPVAHLCSRAFAERGIEVRPGAAGEFVPYGCVALAGLGLLQCAELAQRLELIGAGRDPGGFAQLGFPDGCCSGCGSWTTVSVSVSVSVSRS